MINAYFIFFFNYFWMINAYFIFFFNYFWMINAYFLYLNHFKADKIYFIGNQFRVFINRF